MKNTDPVIGEKLKSKTHLLNTFLILRVWLESFQKVQIWQKNISLGKIQKDIKNAEFHADFDSIEIFFTKCTKKVIIKTSLTYMSISDNSVYFHHMFANNFILCIFSKLFKRIQNQREILRFLIPTLNFWMKIFFGFF